MKKIEVYGADWCPDCVRAKAFLKNNGVTFDFIDTDQNTDAAQFVEQINNGKRIIPTILIEGESYTNPDNYELAAVLNISPNSNEEQKAHAEGCSLEDRSCGIQRADHEVGDEGGH